MNQDRQKQIFTVIAILIMVFLMGAVVMAGSYFSSSETDDQIITTVDLDNSKTILYYSLSCTYCRKVDQWLDENQASSWIEIENKEVSSSKPNSKELAMQANRCGLDAKAVGVPFMVAEGKCFQGEVEIIDYLKQKRANLTDSELVSSASAETQTNN